MKMTCGRYKGRDIAALPSSYLEWVAANWDDDAVATAADKEWRDRERWSMHFEDDDDK